MDIILSFDKWIMWAINRHISSEFMDKIMVFLTRIGDGAIVWIVGILLLFFVVKDKKTAYLTTISIIIGVLVGTLLLKPLFERLRPFIADPQIKLLIPSPAGFSFPSGHAISSFSAATVIYMCNKKYGVFALVIAVLISFSRIYLMVHYPTDILVGTILGIAVGIFTVKFSNFYLKKKSEKQKN